MPEIGKGNKIEDGQIDGRKLGSSGNKKDDRGSRDISFRQVDIDREVHTVTCEESDRVTGKGEGWKCTINGSGSGPQNTPAGFHNLDIDNAEVVTESTGNGERVQFRFPSGGSCKVNTTEYSHPNPNRTLECE